MPISHGICYTYDVFMVNVVIFLVQLIVFQNYALRSLKKNLRIKSYFQYFVNEIIAQAPRIDDIILLLMNLQLWVLQQRLYIYESSSL